MLDRWPAHRLVIVGVLLFIAATVLVRVRWSNVGEVARTAVASSGFTMKQPAAERDAPQPAPKNETVVQRRERLKDELLQAGDALAANWCGASERKTYLSSFARLTEQRLKDMGCGAFSCNFDKGAPAAAPYYDTEKDARVASQLVALADSGKLDISELGTSRILVGRLADMEMLLGAGSGFSPTVNAARCPRAS